jgi:hypothetical protein
MKSCSNDRWLISPSGAIDPLLPLSSTPPMAAVPRERPFSRGSLTGALGQKRTLTIIYSVDRFRRHVGEARSSSIAASSMRSIDKRAT